MSTTSGACASTRSTAYAPSDPVATTVMSAWRPSSCSRPARTRSWSSIEHDPDLGRRPCRRRRDRNGDIGSSGSFRFEVERHGGATWPASLSMVNARAGGLGEVAERAQAEMAVVVALHAVGVEAVAVVGDRRATGPPSRTATVTWRAPLWRTTLRSASCAVRYTRPSVSASRSTRSSGHSNEVVIPAPATGAEQVLQRAGEARVAQVRAGRSTRAACAAAGCPLRVTMAARSRSRAHARPASGPQPGRGGREHELHPGEVLHHAVVEVGGDAAPFRLFGVDRLAQQALPLGVRSLDAPGHRPGQRHLDEGEQQRWRPARAGAACR